MSDTLILSPSYEPADFLPLSVIGWQDTMRLMCLDKIRVVHLYEDRWIKSPSTVIQLPSVAVTTDHFQFRKGRVRFSRHLLYLRDLYQCQYCGEQFNHRDLSIDHVMPRCDGGRTTWENCVTSCKRCNLYKGHKKWTPLNRPFRPDYYALAAKRMELPIQVPHHSWIPYLRVGAKQAEKIQLAGAGR
jgi:5-methylcytosine-specific restriction endonuclease McrA